LVRKLASDHNVDLTSVKGADIGGRIRRHDVLDAIAAANTAAAPALTAAPAPAGAPAPEATAAGGDKFIYHGSENLGVAGLDRSECEERQEAELGALTRLEARSRRVSPDELSGGTFALTYAGSRGVLFDTSIINQPNVAVLGTGAVVKRPVVVKDNDSGEMIAIRSMVYLAVSHDHRVVDDSDAAQFLTTMKARLEEGAFEASLGL
jgi:pyruvate dehydrogenase E2 component (dihydrolipoamide acetyltransferase)